MFVIPPILLEVIFVLVKPQELYAWLTAVQPLYTLPGLILLGFVLDSGRYGLGTSGIVAAPFLKLAVGLYAWCLLTVVIRAPAALVGEAILFGTSLLLCLAIAHSAQTIVRFETICGLMLALTLFFSAIGDQQASAPLRCHYLDTADRTILHYDGRPCERDLDCSGEGADRERTYVCEHAGLLETASVTGRVRFRGNLEDPNELALTTGVGLALAFGFFQRKKSAVRLVLLVASIGLVSACIFFTQSRGGQLVLLVVLGTYAVRRFGWKWALLVGVIAAGPLLFLASQTGRSSEEAEGSSLERIECLAVGIDLLRHSPLIGVGKGQFTEHHYLTAHNSYVLAAAELGLAGFAVWSSVLYIAIKTPIAALRALRDREGPDAEALRTWSTAVLAAMAGATVGSFFLSFSFHPVLWIYIGISGALAATVQRHSPDFRVRLSRVEIAAIVAGDLVLILAIFVYTKYKLG